MAKKGNTHKVFNLIRPLEPPKTYWDKIYEWLLSRAKVVLMLIEVLIVLTFFAKVVVDNTGKNYKQQYEKLKTEIDVEAQAEGRIRRYQQKEVEYRKLWDYSANYNAILSEVYSYLQQEAEVSVLLENNKVTISGYLPLDESRTLEEMIKASSTFQNVVADLTVESQDLIVSQGQFVITADVTKEFAIRAKFVPALKTITQ